MMLVDDRTAIVRFTGVLVCLAAATPAAGQPFATNYPDVEFYSVHEHGGEYHDGDPDTDWDMYDGLAAQWPEASWNILSTSYLNQWLLGIVAVTPDAIDPLTGEHVYEPLIAFYAGHNARTRDAVEAKRAADAAGPGPAAVPGHISWFASPDTTWNTPFDDPGWADAYIAEVEQHFRDGAYGLKAHPTIELAAGFNLINGYCDPVSSEAACTTPDPCGADDWCVSTGVCSVSGLACADDCVDAEENCVTDPDTGADVCAFISVDHALQQCLQEQTVTWELMEPQYREVMRHVTHDLAKPYVFHQHSFQGPDGWYSKCYDPTDGQQRDCASVARNVLQDFADYVNDPASGWTEAGRRRFIMAHGYTGAPVTGSLFEDILDAGLSVDMNRKPAENQWLATDCETNPMCGCYTRSFFRKPEWADQLLQGMQDTYLWSDENSTPTWSVSYNQQVIESVLFQIFEPTSEVLEFVSNGTDVDWIRGADLTTPSAVDAGCCDPADPDLADCEALYDVPEGIVDRLLVDNADELLTPTQRIFLGRVKVAGDMDFGLGFPGVGEADYVCQFEADLEGLGGEWYAVLSTSALDARDRVDVDGYPIFTEGGTTYETVDGTIVAIGATDLFDGALDAGVNVHAEGTVQLGQYYAWSGGLGNGTHYPGYGCADWTDGTNAEQGVAGDIQRTDAGWLGYGLGGCHLELLTYCVETARR